MSIRATKNIDGVTYRLRSPRDLHSLSDDMYIWDGDDGTADYLTEEEEAEYGVKAFRGLLTRPRR